MVEELRAHHGMCLAFFVGEGYGSRFVEAMAKVQKRMQENPEICLVRKSDIICRACPFRCGSYCQTQEKTERYDDEVLRRCGLEEGCILKWEQFQELVREQILLKGKREEICGDCQWNSLCF